jgi:hypothetical protein
MASLNFSVALDAVKYFRLRDRIDTQFGKAVHDVVIEGVRTKACIFGGQDFYAAYRNLHGEPKMMTADVDKMKFREDDLPPGIHWPLMQSLLMGFVPDVLLTEWHRGQMGIHLDILTICTDSVNEYVVFCEKHDIS